MEATTTVCAAMLPWPCEHGSGVNVAGFAHCMHHVSKEADALLLAATVANVLLAWQCCMVLQACISLAGSASAAMPDHPGAEKTPHK